jgi:nucleoside-diphosphate-sugar epimerase
MRSDCAEVLNVGSDEMISINGLVSIIARVAGKSVRPRHIPGPLGVRGRNSDNHLIAAKLGWRPHERLVHGIEKTYPWIAAQVAATRQRLGLSV